MVASQTTTQIVFPVSSMNYFAISDPNCPAADYQLYSDAFGTPWTDTAKVKQDTSVTANSRMYPLVISQATAYSLITLYLGVKTKGGIMGYKQITVSVCQPATFPISPTPKKLMVKKLLPSQGEIPENVITFATVSDCQKTFSVTSDAAGATPSTSPLAYSVADVKFMIDTNAAVFTTVYAKVVTPATYDYFTKVYTYTTAIQPVEVTVCDPTVIVTTGTEVFSLVASQTVTQIVFPVSSMNYFTSS